MINAGSGITPSITDGPPPNGPSGTNLYYSLGVSESFLSVMNQYNNLPQIKKYKQIYSAILTSYPSLALRWNGLQLGSWPAMTDGANYTSIADFALGPAPVNIWSLTSYSSNPAGDAGPPPPSPGWRVPFAPRAYYGVEPDARYQTEFLHTNARLIMGFDDPRDRNPVSMELRDLTKFAQIEAICDAYRGQANTQVNSSVNSEIVGATFTDMQNLSSGGVSQVSPSFTEFGGDLVNLGNLIDLRTLSKLGYPSNLLRQMLNAGGLLPGVYDSLILVGLTDPQISSFKQPDTAIALDVELQIYRALVLIVDNNLKQVLELLDINPDLKVSTAADLLDPKKIFPNSYKTLLIQEPASSGKVQNINVYSSDGTINSVISGYFVGDESYENLKKVIPADQALANSAFIRSMQQIKNITNLDFQEFSASTAALENNNGLSTVNALGAPVPAAVQTTVKDTLATGTGENNSLTLYDLIGTAAGAVHKDNFQKTIGQMAQVDFTELLRLYDLCINTIGGTYDVGYFSIAPPTLTSGGSGYTSASATITPPTGDYCTSLPTFTVTVNVDPFSGTGPVSSIVATSLGSGYRGAPDDTDFPVTITISGDGIGATATTVKGAPSFAFVQLPDGRKFVSCGNAIAGRLKALQALIYTGSGGDNSVPGPWNTVELEAKKLVTTYPDQVAACNTYWAEMAAQMNREAQNRYLAELIFDFATATYPDIKPYSRSSALAMISSLHSFGTETSPNGTADFFNAVAQTNLGGQSVIASLREGRNIEALIDAGAGVDTQIPATPL